MAKPTQENSTQAPPAEVLIDESVDLSKEGLREYLDQAAEAMTRKDDKVAWHSGRAMHLAVAAVILDIAKITGDLRKQVLRKWEADARSKKTLWFGCNASQGRQAYEAKTKVEEELGDYIDSM